MSTYIIEARSEFSTEIEANDLESAAETARCWAREHNTDVFVIDPETNTTVLLRG